MRAHTWANKIGTNKIALGALMFASAFILFVSTAAIARASDLRVALDQAVPMQLMGSASGVVIGNPSIAGVSVENDHLLFVTGRSYGTTSLQVVDANNHLLYSGRITVTPDETHVVMVTRGAQTARMECTPVCRARPDIGDSTASYTALNDQINGHASAAAAH